MTPTRCPSCHIEIPPGQATPSPVPGLFPVLCRGCASTIERVLVAISRLPPISCHNLYPDPPEPSFREMMAERAERAYFGPIVIRPNPCGYILPVQAGPADDPDVMLATCH